MQGLFLPKSETMVREQEAEEARQRGWAVGREASRLMHKWLDIADADGFIVADLWDVEARFVDENRPCVLMAAADLVLWLKNHGITRYLIDCDLEIGMLQITRIN